MENRLVFILKFGPLRYHWVGVESVRKGTLDGYDVDETNLRNFNFVQEKRCSSKDTLNQFFFF